MVIIRTIGEFLLGTQEGMQRAAAMRHIEYRVLGTGTAPGACDAIVGGGIFRHELLVRHWLPDYQYY